MLTSVPGIALALASGLYAEIGDPARDRGLVRLVSYAGIVARLKQSGGPDQEARTQGRSRRACVPLGANEFIPLRPTGVRGVDAHLRAIEHRERIRNAQRTANMTKAARLHLLQHANSNLERKTLQFFS